MRATPAAAAAFLAAWIVVAATSAAELEEGSAGKIAAVRARIVQLEARLEELRAESADAKREVERINAELELAQARVRENELVLARSRDEVVALRGQAAQLEDEMKQRRAALSRHLEMLALLGRPGPLQLMYDAIGGGELDKAVSTVALLTSGQVKLMEEYRRLHIERRERLAALSRTLQGAQIEAAQLVERRRELEQVRRAGEKRLASLESSRRSATDRLADLREREHALERLLTVVAERDRPSAREDIRQFRGALPWPAAGRVVQGFGRHFLPKYATYTVCNGLRLDAEAGGAVKALFPGVVAYARHFKGYGNMVVIDHGHEVYSLVAGLATIHVRVDQGVEMGTPLGLIGPTIPEGNLYLEIRVGGKPRDPRRWLELQEGRT